jgi:hypothetical protein
MMEQEWVKKAKCLSEIIDATDELLNKVWYNRHQVERGKIGPGETKIVENESSDH